ncbi:MAG: cell wall hydrolase [Alitiscatomonas sp.]
MLSASAPAKRRRDTAVLTAGILLVTAITFAAGSFPETGNGAMVAFAETPGETGGQEEGTYDGNTDEEKRDPESIMAAEEAADTENGTETRKEEAENGAETPEGGEAGEGETLDQEAETAVEGSGAQEETASGESAELAEGAAAQETSGTSAPETQEAAASVSLSDRDYQTLLKIVQAEAGNCDRTGRILVANVILNRVESDTFPDTVHSVVYQRHQFSPVGNGSINRCRVTDATVEAVDSALAGEDYSDGALYFMNRRASSRKNVRWFDNHLDFLFKHGNHEFFK